MQIDAKLLKLLSELDKECPPPHTTARLLDKLASSSTAVAATNTARVIIHCCTGQKLGHGLLEKN